jgi:hypothetical protein
MQSLAERTPGLLRFASAPEQSNELRPQDRSGRGEREKRKQSAGLADLGKHRVAVRVERQHGPAQIHPQQRWRYNRFGLPREPIFGRERDDGAPLGFVARTLSTTTFANLLRRRGCGKFCACLSVVTEVRLAFANTTPRVIILYLVVMSNA